MSKSKITLVKNSNNDIQDAKECLRIQKKLIENKQVITKSGKNNNIAIMNKKFKMNEHRKN